MFFYLNLNKDTYSQNKQHGQNISHLDTEQQQRRQGTGVSCVRYDMKVLVILFELCMIVLRFDTDIVFTNAGKRSI